MRRKDLEITDTAAMEDILHEALVAHIGMVDQGIPYVVPMVFAYDDGCLYLHSAATGRKIDILKRNPTVCFQVDVGCEVIPGATPCSFTAKYRSIIGHGQATLIVDAKDKVEALDTMMSRFLPGQQEYKPASLSKVVVIRIDIDSMTGKQAGK